MLEWFADMAHAESYTALHCNCPQQQQHLVEKVATEGGTVKVICITADECH